jgi:hypothetical protein
MLLCKFIQSAWISTLHQLIFSVGGLNSTGSGQGPVEPLEIIFLKLRFHMLTEGEIVDKLWSYYLLKKTLTCSDSVFEITFSYIM